MRSINRRYGCHVSRSDTRFLRISTSDLSDLDIIEAARSRLNYPPVTLAMLRTLGVDTKKALSQLSYREREIIKLRYGLGDGYTYTLEEVGHVFRVTRERVRQIENKAKRSLVRQLQHIQLDSAHASNSYRCHGRLSLPTD